MKKFLIVLLFSQFAVMAQTPEKYHRAKIIYKTIENLQQLEKAGVPMDHGIHKKGYSLTSDFSDSEIQTAKNLGLQVEIEIADVQHFYETQNDPQKVQLVNPENNSCSGGSLATYQTPFNFTTGSMGGYFTYAEMLQQLDNMRALYPELISARANVGSFLTAENRALQWVKITKNPESINTRPQVLYNAVHHAREPISLSETIFYMWYLLENYATNDEVKNIVDHTELYFIPVVNPDGYIYNQTTNPSGGGMWRKNRRSFGTTFGVDNNRNYDYWINGDSGQAVWNTTGVSAATTGETYPGTAPFSEPETQAMRYFVENHHFKIALNAHTYSNLLLYPYGYDLNAPSPDDAYFKKISALMASNGELTPEIASELYAASGDSDDFMYGQTMAHDKIFAFTPEIGSSFWPAASSIIPLSKMMLFTNLTAAKLVQDYPYLKDNTPEFMGSTAIVNANFELAKYGLGGNGNFTVSIHPISSNIISVGLPFTVTNMATSDSVNSSIQLGIAPGTASNDLIVFEYLINNGTAVESKIVTHRFGNLQNIFADNGNSMANWTSTNWGTTNEAFVSPSTSITDSPFGNYSDNSTKYITLTNPINLTGITSATISFSARWYLEAGYDYVTFQVSNNNGVTWTSQCGKYTTLFNGTVPVYTGFHNPWINEEINLSDYAGQTIKVRFMLKSDEAQYFDGFYFDDFKVNLLQNTVLGVNSDTLSAFRIYPNPAQNVVNIDTDKTSYNINVFNLLGQRVLSKNNNDGLQQLDVNALNPGMYLVELQSKDFTETQKFLKK